MLERPRSMKPALALVPATPTDPTRVIGITFRRNDAHEEAI